MEPSVSDILSDLALQLRQGHNPVEVADMLEGLAERMESTDAKVPTGDLEARLAALEARQQHDGEFGQRLAIDLGETDHRLDNLAAAMRECAKKDALHPSVRYVCGTIALNLAAPTGPSKCHHEGPRAGHCTLCGMAWGDIRG